MATEKDVTEEWYRKTFQPQVKGLAAQLRPGITHIDIGSGSGFLALAMAEDLRPQRLILVDQSNDLEIQLPSCAEFHKLDVCSPEFLTRFRDKPHLMTCIRTIHEFDDPAKAIMNLIAILPVGFAIMFIDASESGWQRLQREAKSLGPRGQRHLETDLRRIARTGFGTNEGIKEFWEKKIFPNIPGEHSLIFPGEMYGVMYVAYQWGDIKKPPPHIQKAIESLRS